MKKVQLFHIIIIIVIILKNTIFCQVYLTNITNTPKTYNTCSGTYYDNGGAAGDYTVNVNNRITTFCSNDGTSSIKIDFTQFNIEFSYDKLYIYDGPTTASPLIVMLSGNISPGSFISSGTCLTFKFYSDGFYPFPGWAASISCVPKPSCIANPPANNLCSSATYINNLNGYCGNTSASYTPDTSPDLLADFCGSIENNSWLKFTASSTTATFNVWTSNCTAGNGIQIQIYSTNDCISFNPVSNCWNPMYDVNSTITATGLVVGQDYYIMIDGHTGDVCDYLIGGESGLIVMQLEDVKFNVYCNDLKADIELSIDKGTRIKKFSIEKSEDGIKYEKITNEVLISDPNIDNIYFFSDENRASMSYYRAKFVDDNGVISTSDIKTFKCIENDFDFFPNPCFSNLTLITRKETLGNKIINIYDSYGKLVIHKIYNEKMFNEVLDVSFLESGMYSLHYINNDNVIIKKFIKLNNNK